MDLVIVGAGPSGLAGGREGARHGARVSVLENLNTVGGLARTTVFNGCRYDVGPHRFFTMNQEVRRLFEDVCAEDLIKVARLTRIFYNDRYFDYPLKPVDALLGVGFSKIIPILGSFGISRLKKLFHYDKVENFEDWVVANFGRVLFEIFFKGYTEKVWGIPCSQIEVEWAGQRIKGLSLTTAVVNAVFKGRRKTPKTLVDEFLYPQLGAGQTYKKMTDEIRRRGGEVLLSNKVVRISRDGMRVRAVTAVDPNGKDIDIEGSFFLSSAPLTDTMEMIHPKPPPEVLSACQALEYRNHVGVDLEIEGIPFPDQWIYVNSGKVLMARIANYRNFSAKMASSPNISPVTVEYFTHPGDSIWSAPDHELRKLASDELDRLGLVRQSQVRNGFVVRNEKAYPVIRLGYQRHIHVIRSWLGQLENLLPIGRCGMFKYNNQDHAMSTGLLAARKALGLGNLDPWLVNIDGEYHESGVIEE